MQVLDCKGLTSPIVASSIDAPSEKTQEILRGERIEKEQREKDEKNHGI
ncbi:hypothetical protein BVRB_9g204900 [Beta vulgaris subsp. vulgaris]|nr:hypothetical protein BVRB_9g204900 [Beta vulgaris subsp. vulgaris]